MPHARRVMDKHELEVVTKLHEDFKHAIDGTEGKVIPEDNITERGSTANTMRIGTAASNKSGIT